MQLSEHEEKLLLRGLDKASAPTEVETAADKLFQSLRNRNVSAYDVLEQLEAGADYMPYESEGTPQWEEMRRTADDIGRRNWQQQQQAQAANHKADSAGRSEDSPFSRSSTNDSNQMSASKKDKEPVKLRDSLMVWGSFLVAWLLTHNVIATLIVGFILAGLWVGSRIFRRIVVWGSIAVAVMILFAILHSLASSNSSQPTQHLNTAAHSSAQPLSPAENPSSLRSSQPVITSNPDVAKLVKRIDVQPLMQEQIAKYKAEDQQTDLDKSLGHATSFSNDWAPRAVLEQLPAPRAQLVSPPAAPRAIPVDLPTPQVRRAQLVNPTVPRAELVDPYPGRTRAGLDAE
jgi:hypothetical protein